MASGLGLKSKVNGILRKVTPLDRTVFKRVIARKGGSSLTGRKGSVAYTDTLFDPQPAYTVLTVTSFMGGRSSSMPILSGGKAITVGDFAVKFSSDAITLNDLQNTDMVLVFKDSNGLEETYEILGHTVSAYQGVTAAFTVYARSIKR